MPSKIFSLPGIGEITVIKRRGNRNIRLSFDNNGGLRASLPPYAPYRSALLFAEKKRTWIEKHRPPIQAKLENEQIFIDKYHLQFVPSKTTKKPTFRLKNDRILVTFPLSLKTENETVQAAARRGIIRALKAEAEQQLPARLKTLAETHGYRFKSVKIKPLKRRWGSCDSAGNITLNLYLIQLTPEQIDYVLIHELTHTKFPHHQASFWSAMERSLPSAKQLRRTVRSLQPSLGR